MIAWLGFSDGTGTCPTDWDTPGPTTGRMICGSDDCVTFQESPAERELIILQNAIKATETMVDIGRGFVDYMKTVFRGRVLLMRRLLFCKSGYLPKRIRRKRRSK